MDTDIDRIRVVTIEDVIQETPSVRTLMFKDPLSFDAKPGQFLMVWIPRAEELPMSVMVAGKKDYAAITVRKHGFGSTSMFNKRAGEMIGVRGPYGNEFDAKGVKNALLVGGGTGLVPLLRLAATKLDKAKVNTTAIIGSRTKEEVFFEKKAKDLLRNTKCKVIVTTEDGSYGVRGYATDAMLQILNGTGKKKKFDCVYTCGPELMMKKVYDIAAANSVPVQASLERYMKCGIGICSSCCIGDRLVCKDGTVFNEKQLAQLPEFGRVYRDKSGRKTAY